VQEQQHARKQHRQEHAGGGSGGSHRHLSAAVLPTAGAEAHNYPHSQVIRNRGLQLLATHGWLIEG
jgi:hypothetical protein